MSEGVVAFLVFILIVDGFLAILNFKSTGRARLGFNNRLWKRTAIAIVFFMKWLIVCSIMPVESPKSSLMVVADAMI